MRLSTYARSLGGGEDAGPWGVHAEALRRRARGEDVIVLSMGDHDLDTDDRIVSAAMSSLGSGDTHYAALAGQPELRAAIAGFHTDAYGDPIGPENVVVTQGAQNGVFTAAACVLDPGDEVIVLDPCYVTYPAVLTARTDRIRRVSLHAEDAWVLQPEALAAAVTPQTRAILLNSPANPTGVALPPDVWRAVADICVSHDLWLISDEVYATLTYDRPHLSPRTLPGMAERTLSVFSLSKGWAMTGFRCGWVVGPTDAITAAEEVVTAVNFGIPPFVQQSALTALGEAADVAGRIRDIYAERRDVICAALESRAGLAVRRPDAGMFVLLDVRHLGRDATDVAWDLLDSQGVSLVPADAFGPALAGHLRLSFSQPVARLLEAAERIAAFLDS